MTSNQLIETLYDKPFKPFDLITADGQRTRITHPEACAYRGGQVLLYMLPNGAGRYIDLNLVASLEIVVPNGDASKQGKKKKK